MKRNLFVIALAIIFLILLALSPVNAATEEEIEESVALGLTWLADAQADDGGWGWYAGDWSNPGVTGIVLLKFEDRAKELGLDPLSEEYDYHANVQDGLNYLFEQMSISGEEISIGQLNYYTSIALLALTASDNPGKTVGSLGSAVDDMTYEEVAQGLLNWVIAAQPISGCAEGGWGYGTADPSWADQSNTGYSVLSLTQAQAPSPEGFGLTIPDATKTELLVFLGNVQVVSGGSLYNPCWGSSSQWVNILKTGSLLQEHAFAGTPATDPDVLAATAYIEEHWNDAGPHPEFLATSLGWKDSYQAMFCMMKGFESYNVELLDIDGDGIPEHDWFDEVSSWIIDNQNPDGTFVWIDLGTGEIYEGDESEVLRTAWALLTLEKFVPDITMKVPVDLKPGSCPNSFKISEKGVLPAGILGTDELDVTQIDPASIKLITCNEEDPAVGVSPLRWSYEMVAQPPEWPDEDACDCEECDEYYCWQSAYNGDVGDEYMDLILKFDAVAVSTYLGDVDSGCIKIKLVGNLKEEEGGQAFEGCDTLRILVK